MHILQAIGKTNAVIKCEVSTKGRICMSYRKKGSKNRPLESCLHPEDNEFLTIMESDLEDYEVAAELGISPPQVSQIRRELFED
jgi:hypothetical protein